MEKFSAFLAYMRTCKRFSIKKLPSYKGGLVCACVN